MYKKKLLVVFGCVIALAFCLAGCTSSSPDPVAQSRAAFTGTWDLSGMEENGQPTSQEDLDTLKTYGLEVYLDLNEDGTASLNLFGEQVEGTWEPSTEDTASITLDGAPVDIRIEDGQLNMEQDGSKLTFVKGESHESDSSDSAQADADDEAASDESASDEAASGESASDEAASAEGESASAASEGGASLESDASGSASAEGASESSESAGSSASAAAN